MNTRKHPGRSRELQRLVFLFAAGLAAAVTESCLLVDEHILTVHNDTQAPVEGLVVVTTSAGPARDCVVTLG